MYMLVHRHEHDDGCGKSTSESRAHFRARHPGAAGEVTTTMWPTCTKTARMDPAGIGAVSRRVARRASRASRSSRGSAAMVSAASCRRT